MSTKLQLALDRLTKEECFQIVEETSPWIDWIEIGTGVIKEYGVSIIKEMKEAYPKKVIIADMKTCDAGKPEAIQAFDAGADITTVMAFAADKTITDTLEVANQYGKRVMIDLLEVKEQQRIEQLSGLGVDLLSLHVGKDQQLNNTSVLDHFTLIEPFAHFEISIAGGLDMSTIPAILEKKPDIIIVGSAITKADQPKEAARQIKELINPS